MSVETRRWKFGWCEYVELSRQLVVNGEAVKLEWKPLEVLQQLLEHSTEVLTKEDLLAAAWSTFTGEQSLSTAISKLRKAIGGPRDSIILNVAGIGYRMAVPVVCKVDRQSGTLHLNLTIAESIPGRPHWRAERHLGGEDGSPVWVARHVKTLERRVFKFAGTGVRLRALQREVTISRLFQNALGYRAEFTVRVLDWGFEEPPFFMESEYCGSNLSEWAKTDEFLGMSIDERVGLAAQLAEGIGAAHALGILHNDLKPSNILINKDLSRGSGGNSEHESGARAGAWHIKIADFGVASFADPHRLREIDITHHGSFDTIGPDSQTSPVGTAMYRAPELHGGGTPTVLGDVYALGVILYQILCGDFQRPPSPGWEARIADPLLRRDIATAANIDPALRMANASELAQRLRNLEARRVEEARLNAEWEAGRQAEVALNTARLRRPWMILASTAVLIGLCTSLWLYRRASLERDLANTRAATLSAMYEFMAQDLLGQSNPYSGVAGSDRSSKQTLVEAINTVLPRIDPRFSKDPGVAGQLHEAIADSLRNRTAYPQADEEYAISAARFRQAEGGLSQNAIVAELKRASAQLSSRIPGTLEAAGRELDEQEKLIAKLDKPGSDVQGWRASVKAGILGLGTKPEQALPLLTEALRVAKARPDFDPTLLTNLKMRICGIYIRLGDGPGLERMSREVIQDLTRLYGPESPAIFPLDMYLQEAFYMEERYPETIKQADLNYQHFHDSLGKDHQLTLATLANRAAAEAQMEDYEGAVRDDLAMHDAEQSNASGHYMAEGSLHDAALFACHLGRYSLGIQLARQVIRETSSGSLALPLFANGSKFTLAECLISQAEKSHVAASSRNVSEADDLLRQVDVKTISALSGNPEYEGIVNVAKARLALLRGRNVDATEYASKAEPFFVKTGADPYEKKALAQVQNAIKGSPCPALANIGSALGFKLTEG